MLPIATVTPGKGCPVVRSVTVPISTANGHAATNAAARRIATVFFQFMSGALQGDGVAPIDRVVVHHAVRSNRIVWQITHE